MALNGSSVLLYAETPAGSATFVAVGSQKNVTFSEKTAAIDVSNKDSRSAKTEPGRYSCTAKLDACYVPSDNAMASIQNALRNGSKFKIRRFENGVAIEEATVVVTQQDTAFPDQGESTISVDATLDGEWSAV